MQFSEAELTAAVTGVAKAAFAAGSKDLRKGKVDLEQAWHDLGGHGRYQLLEPIGSQVLPILIALPDVPRVHGERPSYSNSEIKDVVEEQTGDEGGRIRRKAIVLSRIALVQTALAHVPVWKDPAELVVPDSLEGL